jgi:hypothetical protein
LLSGFFKTVLSLSAILLSWTKSKESIFSFCFIYGLSLAQPKKIGKLYRIRQTKKGKRRLHLLLNIRWHIHPAFLSNQTVSDIGTWMRTLACWVWPQQSWPAGQNGSYTRSGVSEPAWITDIINSALDPERGHSRRTRTFFCSLSAFKWCVYCKVIYLNKSQI